jgi:hypothetical protein
METINLILIAVGILVILIGVMAFLMPNWARFINLPGGPRFKATAAIIVGIILTSIGFLLSI